MATQRLTRIIQLQVQAEQYNREMKKIAQSTQKVEKQLGGIRAGMQKLNRIGNLAVGGIAALGSVKLATGLIKTTDSIILMESAFGQLLKSGERGADMMERVYSIAEVTGAPLESVGKSVQQLSVGLGAMGASNEEIAEIAENFLKLGRIGGKQIEDVNGALYQFSQALASNRLQGDEFRAVLERVPLVAQKIADYLEVDIGALKDLAQQGIITADVMRKSMTSASDDIDESFSALPAIWEQGVARIQTAFLETAVTMSKVTGATTALAEGMSAFAKVIRALVNPLTDFIQKMGHITETISEAFGVLADVFVNSDSLSASFARVTTLAVGLGAALYTVFTNVGLVAKAMTFLAAHPVVSVLAGIALAAYTIYKNFNLLEEVFRFKIPIWLAELSKVWNKFLGKMAIHLNTLIISLNEAFDLDIGQIDLSGFRREIEQANDTIDLFKRKLAEFREEQKAPAGETKTIFHIINEQAQQLIEEMLPKFKKALAESAENFVLAEVVVTGVKRAGDAVDEFNAKLQKLRGLDPFAELSKSLQDNYVLSMIGRIEPDDRLEADALEIKQYLEDKFQIDFQVHMTEDEKLQTRMLELNTLLDKIDARPGVDITPEFRAEVLTNAADSWRDLSDATDNWKDKMLDAVKGFQTDFVNTIVDGVAEGKMAFDDLLQHVLKVLAKMALDAALAPVFDAIAGSIQPNTLVATPVPAGGPALLAGPGIGQTMNVGLMTTPTYGHGARSGRRGGVNINVNNYGNDEVQVEQRQNRQGGVDIDILIEQKVNRALSNGSLDRTLSSSFGIARRAF